MLFGLLTWTNIGWALVAWAVVVIVRWLNSDAAKQQGGWSQHQQQQQQQRRTSGGGFSPRGSWGGGPDGHGDQHDEDAGSVHRDGVRLPKQKVEGATGEIARILTCVDYYAVLEVARDAPAVEVKRSYRVKQMATHPDKNHGMPGAKEASQRVNAAYDVLGDEIRRRQYNVSLADEEQYGPRRGRAGQGGSGGQSPTMADLAAAFDEYVRETMGPPPPGSHYPTLDPAAYDCWSGTPEFRMCCSCGFDHVAVKVPNRTAWRARLCHCSDCGVFGEWLPARDNDVWFESSNRWLHNVAPETYTKAYRCVGGHVYDITPWAKCQGLFTDSRGNAAPCNTHYVPLRVSSQSGGGRQHAEKRNRERDPDFGFNQFKGNGNSSNNHKQHTNNKKKKKKGRR